MITTSAAPDHPYRALHNAWGDAFAPYHLKGFPKAPGWMIWRRLNTQNGNAWPSQATIATEGGVSERTVRRAIKEMAARNMITTTRRMDSSTIYRLVDPGAWVAPLSQSVEPDDMPKTVPLKPTRLVPTSQPDGQPLTLSDSGIKLGQLLGSADRRITEGRAVKERERVSVLDGWGR